MTRTPKATKIVVTYPDRIITLNTNEAAKVMQHVAKFPGVTSLNWKIKKNHAVVPEKKLDPDLKAILDQYATLTLINNDESLNIEFWNTHLNTLSLYLTSEFQIKRWLTKHLGNLHLWNINHKTRQSQTAKGLRERIRTWLMREFSALERGRP